VKQKKTETKRERETNREKTDEVRKKVRKKSGSFSRNYGGGGRRERAQRFLGKISVPGDHTA